MHSRREGNLKSEAMNSHEREQHKQELKKQSLKRAKLTAWLFGVCAMIALIGVSYLFIQNAQAQKARMEAELQAQVCRERAVRAETEVVKMRDLAEAQRVEVDRELRESRAALIECRNQTAKGRSSK